jgi:hypothetical protein
MRSRVRRSVYVAVVIAGLGAIAEAQRPTDPSAPLGADPSAPLKEQSA